MAQLILTEEEKAALTWAELPDAAVGAATKRVMSAILTVAHDLEKLEIAAVAQHLIHQCIKVNAAKGKWTLEGISFGDEQLGDWRVIVERIK